MGGGLRLYHYDSLYPTILFCYLFQIWNLNLNRVYNIINNSLVYIYIYTRKILLTIYSNLSLFTYQFSLIPSPFFIRD